MVKKEEFEIVQHTMMNYLEIFLVEMTARSPHGHGDLEIGILLDGSLTLFTEFKQHELHAGHYFCLCKYRKREDCHRNRQKECRRADKRKCNIPEFL